MGLNVLFPSDLETKCMAIRTTYVRYDHLSDTCATYERPAIHPQIDKGEIDSPCLLGDMKFPITT